MGDSKLTRPKKSQKKKGGKFEIPEMKKKLSLDISFLLCAAPPSTIPRRASHPQSEAQLLIVAPPTVRPSSRWPLRVYASPRYGVMITVAAPGKDSTSPTRMCIAESSLILAVGQCTRGGSKSGGPGSWVLYLHGMHPMPIRAIDSDPRSFDPDPPHPPPPPQSAAR